jgi:hypothetical protein
MRLFISTKAHTMASADMLSMVVLEPSRWMMSAPIMAPITPPRFQEPRALLAAPGENPAAVNVDGRRKMAT